MTAVGLEHDKLIAACLVNIEACEPFLHVANLVYDTDLNINLADLSQIVLGKLSIEGGVNTVAEHPTCRRHSRFILAAHRHIFLGVGQIAVCVRVLRLWLVAVTAMPVGGFRGYAREFYRQLAEMLVNVVKYLISVSHYFYLEQISFIAAVRFVSFQSRRANRLL